MKVSEGVLRASGLWKRELFYLEQVEERPIPAMSFSRLKCNDIPEGWRQVSPHWHPTEVVRGWEFRLGIEMYRNAWSRSVISDSEAEEKWMNKLDEGCSTWGLKGSRDSLLARMLKLSRRAFWRWRCTTGNPSFFGRCLFSRGKGVWMPGTALRVVNACDNDESVSFSHNGECAVCQEPQFLIPRSCGHRFCLDCRVSWREVSDTCPLCRRLDEGIRFPPLVGRLVSADCACRGPACVCDLDDY